MPKEKEAKAETFPDPDPRAGSINEPPGSNVYDRDASYFTDGTPPELPAGGVPVLTSISPDTAAIGAADVTLHCIGTGFGPKAVITFNGGDEPTTFVSKTEVTTIVKPSTATTAGTYPVTVKNPSGESAPQGFTFTQAGTTAAAVDPDDLEEEIEEEMDDAKPTRSAPKKKK